MDLKEILSYRSKCLICQTDMEMKSLDLAGVRLFEAEDGLEVKTGHKDIAVLFNYSGVYHKMKKWNTLYAQPLSVLKECPICIPDIEIRGEKKKIRLKSRSLGATTLMHLRDLRCAYTFNIFGDSEGNYAVNLNWEDIKFNDGHNFYHINTKFEDNRTELLSGNFQNDSIDSMFRLGVPAVNTSKIQDREQLINKLKLYNLFS